ncbi:GDNF family receptor alpha-3 [Protopterus annectens]|uniref:GDNF family receptor alpha-3 n=1 Tax=Protopterus annectens TaxID=7888 RepID=UPI001CFA58E1|nr:GDNF family receptor alpha-3 [Protopterus annectens]
MGFLRIFAFLCLAGSFQVTRCTFHNDCLAAEKSCIADAVCSTAYSTLQSCLTATGDISLLSPDNQTECKTARITLQRSHFQNCRCQRGMKKEEQCLKIYWDINPGFTTHGFLDMEFDSSPYEEAVVREPWQGIDYTQVAALLSGPGDAANPCLYAADICSHDEKCAQHRSAYVSTCNRKGNNGHSCDRRRCHKTLRHFFEKVPQDYSLGVLLCSCKDDPCGERRRQTIVPGCSFEEEEKPNCLYLLEECNKENICRSRLANFKQNCQMSGKSESGCLQQNLLACLMSYVGMIGTIMTPNYISNSSQEVSLWCSCDRSGNQKEECDKIQHMFASNSCFRNAVEFYMNPKQEAGEKHNQHVFATPSSFQQDDIAVILSTDVNQVAAKEAKVKHLDIESPQSEEAAKAVVPAGAAERALPCPFLVLSLHIALCLLCVV